MGGLIPVVEMQFDAFAYPAFERITSHLAQLRNRTRGRVSLPIVVRIPFGDGVGSVEHHSDSSEAYYTHTAGLRVVTPGTPSDAYRLLRQSIACPDPVIFRREPAGRRHNFGRPKRRRQRHRCRSGLRRRRWRRYGSAPAVSEACRSARPDTFAADTGARARRRTDSCPVPLNRRME
jgi:Transketolase, pyrimidine binding domain